jgi:fatty-acyl-CoA synthase
MGGLGDRLGALGALARAGWLDPARQLASGLALVEHGPTLAALVRTTALRHGDRPAVVDDAGTLTARALDEAAAAAADGLAAVALGTTVGVLAGNGRATVVAQVAAARLGRPVVLLNTGFAAPQLREVVRREGVGVLVVDPERARVALEAAAHGGPVVVAVGAAVEGVLRLDARRARPGFRLPHPQRPALPVLLTSGTTGTPKGARRGPATPDLVGATALLRALGLREGDVVVIAPPLFHAWGLGALTLTLAVGGTAVVTGDPRPDRLARAVADHRATVLVAVPVLLRRLLDDADARRRDLSSLRVVAVSGSALPPALATAWMDAHGDNLHDLYGSTEVGQATLATPADLRAAPGTVGRPLPGSVVRIVDKRGRPVPAGTTGRIVVRTSLAFAGYTGGGGKPVVDGLLDTGDVGHLDGAGRLFVTGRSDDMIVSGGENVFPAEVEATLAAHPGVAEVAVVGVPDAEFGQRLRAYVVARPGAVVDPDDLRRTVRERLARFKVPRDVVVVAALPRTASGKVIRAQLTSASPSASSAP